MELCDIDVKMEDKGLTIILLAYLSPSFLNSLGVGKDSITFEEVKSSLYSRECKLKASRNSDEAFAFGLSVTNFAKG